MASTAGSLSARATAWSTASHTPSASAFTGGLSMVRTATRSCTAYRTKSDIGAVFLMSFDEDARRRPARVDFVGGVDDARLGDGGAIAGVNDVRLAADFANLAAQGSRVIDLQFERGEEA